MGSEFGIITPMCLNKNAVCDMNDGDCEVIRSCMCGSAKL